MSQIKIQEALVIDTDCLQSKVETVEIAESPLFQGGFGWIYECISVNKKSTGTLLLVKVLKDADFGDARAGYETIVKLQKKYIARSKKQKYNAVESLPALKAFPLCSFRGTLDGEKVFGYIAVDLKAAGFISFDEIINISGERTRYMELPFSIRFRYCYHLAKGFDHLVALGYVHADINPKNIFIDWNSGALALIDYDGGGVLEKSGDSTLTHGKLEDGEWLAPEIYESITNAVPAKPGFETDRWSVTVAFHFLLFLCDPFFFIKEQSTVCKRDYLASAGMYPVDLNNENVSPNAGYIMDTYENSVRANLPAELHRKLVENYREGFDAPFLRVSYTVWTDLFAATQVPPGIDFFRANKKFAFRGTELLLSWKTRDALTVNIDHGIGDVAPEGNIRVRVNDSSLYTLTVTGHFGRAEALLDIGIFPLPVIETLKVPAPGKENLPAAPAFPAIELPEIRVKEPFVKLKSPAEPGRLLLLYEKFVKLKPEYLPVKNKNSIASIFDKIKAMFKKRI